MTSPLANPTFRRLYAAQVVGLAGAGLTTIALALLAYDLAGAQAGPVLGAALALKMVAYVGVAPVAGGFAHRAPRRAMLAGLNVVRALVVAALPFVDTVWQVYALVFALSAASAGFTPVLQATIPDVLPDEAQYTRALSLSRIAQDLENLLAPMIAAGLLTATSFHSLFWLNGAAFALAGLLVLSAALPPARRPEREAGMLANVAWGLRIYARTPRLRGLLLLSMAVAAAGAMVIVNTVVYVRGALGGSETDLAVAMAAVGAGSMLAALCLPRGLDRIRDRTAMLAGGGALACGLWLGLASPGFAGLLAIWFLLGVGASLVQTPSARLLRRSSHAGDRPAVYAAQFSLSHACWLITYPAAGWLGSVAGLPATFAACGALVALACVAAALVWRPRGAAALAHTHEPIRHTHLHVHDEHHRHEHEGWEPPEPHRHPHRHERLAHSHPFVIDDHHRRWPPSGG